MPPSTSRPYIGGQAVLEGVMMRSPGSFVVAVRRPDGGVAVREQVWSGPSASLHFLRWPLLRGAVTLVESLWNGYSALAFSAEQAMPSEASAAGVAPSDQSSASTLLAMGISTVFAVALFVATPHLLTVLTGRLLGLDLPTTSPAFHALDAAFKLGILVGYLALIARSREVQRVFQYHGAEHKTIWAYESGGPLTADAAARFSTLHPRCGTSFLVMVMGVSLLVSAVVFARVPQLSPHLWLHHVMIMGIKLPLMLPVAGLTYELQRATARPGCPKALKWLASPGMALQRITTREPSRDQLEIAVIALSRALAREQGEEAADGVVVYPAAATVRAQ